MVLVLIGINLVGGGNYMRATIMGLLCELVEVDDFVVAGDPFMWGFLHLDRRYGHVSAMCLFLCLCIVCRYGLGGRGAKIGFY